MSNLPRLALESNCSSLRFCKTFSYLFNKIKKKWNRMHKRKENVFFLLVLVLVLISHMFTLGFSGACAYIMHYCEPDFWLLPYILLSFGLPLGLRLPSGSNLIILLPIYWPNKIANDNLCTRKLDVRALMLR